MKINNFVNLECSRNFCPSKIWSYTVSWRDVSLLSESELMSSQHILKWHKYYFVVLVKLVEPDIPICKDKKTFIGDQIPVLKSKGR